MRITTIGTCRVYHPFEAAEKLLGYQLDNRSLYGFVHAGPEVLQQIRYAEGRFDYPPELSDVFTDLVDVAPGRGLAADAYLVEISSRKLYEFDGLILQKNRTDQRLKRYPYLYEVLTRHPLDPNARMDAIPAAEVARLDDLTRQVMERMTVRIVGEDELEENMASIVEALGTVVFVTHCGAFGKDGRRIKDRQKVMQAMLRIGAQRGFRVYDPTPLMDAFGQDTAMPPGDVNHYTPDFELAVAADLYPRLQEAAQAHESPPPLSRERA
jgi:hypothetical protein